MKHVINFSGGLCSFWAAKRVVDEQGAANVTLLFADTLIEDADLYRFNEDAAAHLGVPITRLCEGRTPWQLFRDEGLIGNSKIPVCSIRLKREVLDKWHRENCLEMDTVIYIGMDWTEENRLARLRKEKPFWRFEAPMQHAPIWDKCRMVAETEALGIKVPRLYQMGFPHNNCGGRCVTAGISHWVHLYGLDRPAFMEWAIDERDTMKEFAARGITPLTILKDRRGGTVQNLSLFQLVDRIEAGEKFTRHDWGGCGCSVQYQDAA